VNVLPKLRLLVLVQILWADKRERNGDQRNEGNRQRCEESIPQKLMKNILPGLKLFFS
jgi:hypothetical protein